MVEYKNVLLYELKVAILNLTCHYNGKQWCFSSKAKKGREAHMKIATKAFAQSTQACQIYSDRVLSFNNIDKS